MVSLVRSIPPLPSTERGRFTNISADPKGERILYCNGCNVIFRSITPLVEDNGGEAVDDIFTYREHAKKTTCVAMSPNGNWVLTGDVSGKCRLWGSRGEHVLKNEYQLWAGTIAQLGWSGDSTRIVACGDGAQTKAAAMIWDTGSKTGDVTGHSKAVNGISFRSQRPFRVATCSEDMSVQFFAGPPFKPEKAHANLHSNFVNCVKYSPDGEWCVSGGADSKLCLFDGKSGELVKEFTKPAGMTGSIWALDWSPDSALIVTAGGDKNLRVWDRDSGAQAAATQVGDAALGDMQVGVCWPAQERVVSVCLDGRILFWDMTVAEGPAIAAAVEGTQGPLASVACDPATGTVLSGGPEGTILVAPPNAAPSKGVIGTGVSKILAHSPGTSCPEEVVVVANDEMLRMVSTTTGQLLSEPIPAGFVVDLAWFNAEETKLAAIVSDGSLMCVDSGAAAWTLEGLVDRRPSALAVCTGSTTLLAVAIANSPGMTNGVENSDFDIRLYNVADVDSQDSLSEPFVVQGHKAHVWAMQFSPGGEMMASSDSGKMVLVWSVDATGGLQQLRSLMGHTARVTCLVWLPGATHLVSGSLDQDITVWKVDGWKKSQVKAAHRLGVTSLTACADKVIASAGVDGYVNMYQIE